MDILALITEFRLTVLPRFSANFIIKKIKVLLLFPVIFTIELDYFELLLINLNKNNEKLIKGYKRPRSCLP